LSHLQLTSNLCHKPLASPEHPSRTYSQLSKSDSRKGSELRSRLLLQVQQNCQMCLLGSQEAEEKLEDRLHYLRLCRLRCSTVLVGKQGTPSLLSGL
jgi:hypothetical protein